MIIRAWIYISVIFRDHVYIMHYQAGIIILLHSFFVTSIHQRCSVEFSGWYLQIKMNRVYWLVTSRFWRPVNEWMEEKKIYPFAVTAHGLSSNSMAEFSHQIYFAMQYVFSNWGMCFILSSQFKWFATKPRFPLGWIIVFPSPFSTWKRSRLRKKIIISHVFRGQVLISTGSLDRGTKISRVRTRLDSAVFCRLSVFKCFVPYYTQPTRQKLPKIDIAYFVSLRPYIMIIEMRNQTGDPGLSL